MIGRRAGDRTGGVDPERHRASRGRCGALGLAADCCPDWGTAALPVPDLIEEMISRTLEDGGQVLVVHDAPGTAASLAGGLLTSRLTSRVLSRQVTKVLTARTSGANAPGRPEERLTYRLVDGSYHHDSN